MLDQSECVQKQPTPGVLALVVLHIETSSRTVTEGSAPPLFNVRNSSERWIILRDQRNRNLKEYKADFIESFFGCQKESELLSMDPNENGTTTLKPIYL